MRKKIFIDSYECENIIKNWHNFLKIIQDYMSYLVEFNINKSIKEKSYSSNYIINDPNWQLLIIIIYDKSIFLANNEKKQA